MHVKRKQTPPQPRLVCADIGANLTDGMFKGSYNGKVQHPPDLDAVLQRAWAAGTEARTLTRLIGMGPPHTQSSCTLLSRPPPPAPHSADHPAGLTPAGVDRIIITAGNLQESKAALELARTSGTHNRGMGTKLSYLTLCQLFCEPMLVC